MQTLAKQILGQAAGAPEGTPMVAKELLHLPKLESQRALRSKKKDTPKSRQGRRWHQHQALLHAKSNFLLVFMHV